MEYFDFEYWIDNLIMKNMGILFTNFMRWVFVSKLFLFRFITKKSLIFFRLRCTPAPKTRKSFWLLLHSSSVWDCNCICWILLILLYIWNHIWKFLRFWWPYRKENLYHSFILFFIRDFWIKFEIHLMNSKSIWIEFEYIYIRINWKIPSWQL